MDLLNFLDVTLKENKKQYEEYLEDGYFNNSYDEFVKEINERINKNNFQINKFKNYIVYLYEELECSIVAVAHNDTIIFSYINPKHPFDTDDTIYSVNYNDNIFILNMDDTSILFNKDNYEYLKGRTL